MTGDCRREGFVSGERAVEEEVERSWSAISGAIYTKFRAVRLNVGIE